MVRRFSSFLIVGLALFMLTDAALAQSRTERARALRADETIQLRARLGISTYGGDRDDRRPEDFYRLKVAGHLNSANISLGPEVGYSFSPFLTAGIAYQFAKYSRIDRRFPFQDFPGTVTPIDDAQDSTTRHTLHAMLRWLPFAHWRISPYVHGGLNYSFGSVDLASGESETASGFGPLVGLGVDFVVSNHVSIFAEMTGFYQFPDDGIDLADPEVEGDETDFDLLGFYGVGVAYRFKSACTPVEILNVEGPSRIAMGEPITFTATVNEEATQPVEYMWDFGDGTTEAGGQTITHTFDTPGNYTITLTATNCGGSVSQSAPALEIFDPCPVPAEIVSMSFDPDDPIFNETIRFTANVNADPPATYSWDFGDGATSTDEAPTHRYTDPGDYTVVLEVSNCEDETDSRTLELVVGEFRCSEITELNSVFFETNSAELDDEARALLDENIAILRECPEINVRLDGYSSRGERNPLQLSEDRATSVEQYYIENGISPNRITKQGLGLDPEAGKGKDAYNRRNRRVDSIILR